MDVILYTNSSDKRNLSKSISEIATVSCNVKYPLDILNPTLILNYNPYYLNCNYVYIPEYGRYYYAKIEVESGSRAEIACTVDVLMSYNVQIKNINCVISRYENAGLSIVPDTNIMVQNYNPVYIYNFPMHFDVGFGSYIMQVIGGMS